jgi:ribosomal protein L30/L7E
MRRTCGKEGCRCQKDRHQRHRSLYVGLKLKGKQHMVYVPKDWEDLVREWVGRHREIRDVLEKLSLACLKRLQTRKG